LLRISEYQAAKTEQEINEARIAELEDRLARAEVIDVSKLSGDTIKFGATMTLTEEDTGQKKVWQIVGEPKADAHKGKISVTSPIARALIGKTKEDTVEVDTPGGAKIYKIRRVEWLEHKHIGWRAPPRRRWRPELGDDFVTRQPRAAARWAPSQWR
jgi:transcription elongation factor GreA